MRKTALKEYIQQCIAQHGLKRGEIPRILGFTNSNKALRRFDAVLSGNVSDVDFIKRLRNSSYFGGPGLESALQGTIRKQVIDEQERNLTNELRHRRAFCRHGWIETELKGANPPRGMICMAIPKTKYIHIPDEVFRNRRGNILSIVGKYFNQLIDDQESKVNQCTIFGEPVRILFRDSFDHCHVFDIKRRSFVGKRSINWRTDEVKYLYY